MNVAGLVVTTGGPVIGGVGVGVGVGVAVGVTVGVGVGVAVAWMTSPLNRNVPTIRLSSKRSFPGLLPSPPQDSNLTAP